MVFLKYILLSSIFLGICFLVYKILYRSDNNFRHLRLFLLASIVLSLICPLSNFQVNIEFPAARDLTENAGSLETTEYAPLNVKKETVSSSEVHIIDDTGESRAGWINVLLWVYYAGLGLMLCRILIQLITIPWQFLKSERTRKNNLIFLRKSGFNATFSFFNWIFIGRESFHENDYNQILSHEAVHASQMHSFDIILVELLTSVMWFNPFAWLHRKEIRLVHEYLADEGALDSGIDRIAYQATLLNHVTEDKLLSFSSPFSSSIIKKRMTMMTKTKNNRGLNLKILALLPLSAIILFAVACVNSTNKEDVVTAVETTQLKTLWLGIENPVKIATSGYNTSDISVSVDNGKISGYNGEYMVTPTQLGTLNFTIHSDDKEISSTSFNVLHLPDPIAGIETPNGFKRWGDIRKSEYLGARGITAKYPEWVQFQTEVEIISFVLEAVIGEWVIPEPSSSGNFTAKQRALLRDRLPPGGKFYITNIVARGVDNQEIPLNTLFFTSVN